ncbi:MAG TPA: hypothetical protein DEQ02_05625 [Ruminococcaceae bacterium]|nr:hypothetical protein [Oscillospiraceae bacterium]
MKPQVYFTFDGSKTTCYEKSNGKVLRQGVATCSLKDTFDRDIGLKLAFARMLGSARKVKRRANVGEYVRFEGDDTSLRTAGAIFMCLKPGALGQRTYERGDFEHGSPVWACGNYTVLENYKPEPEPPKWSWEGFMKGKYMIECRTPEEKAQLLIALHGKKFRRYNGSSLLTAIDSDYTHVFWDGEKLHECYEQYRDIDKYTVFPYSIDMLATIDFIDLLTEGA